MAFQHWHDMSTTAEAGQSPVQWVRGRVVPQPAPVPPPGTDLTLVAVQVFGFCVVKTGS